MNDAPPVKQTAREDFFNIIEFLCSGFNGLSPFDILNNDLEDVYNMCVDLAISTYKKNKDNKTIKNKDNAVWVTSKTATWH